MNASDFIIIYLSCGAPFAVYYLLSNRRRINLGQLIFKTVLNFIVWIPSALKIVSAYHFGRNEKHTKRKIESKAAGRLQAIQKQLEHIAGQSNYDFYDFREVLNRYVGLTISLQAGQSAECETEQEIFQIGNFQNAKIGTICLQRRNSQRLLFHQTNAAENFLETVGKISGRIGQHQIFLDLSYQLIENLNDSQTKLKFDEMLGGNLFQQQKIIMDSSKKRGMFYGTPANSNNQPIS